MKKEWVFIAIMMDVHFLLATSFDGRFYIYSFVVSTIIPKLCTIKAIGAYLYQKII